MARDVATVSEIKPQGLKNTSFNLAQTAIKRRLIVAADAERGAGKTQFLLSAPDPIAFIDLDLNADGVVQKVQKKKKVYHAKYNLPMADSKNIDKVADAAGDVWERVLGDFVAAAHDSTVRSIGVDTGTELWELLRLALYGKLTQIISREYSHANAIYKQLIREVENTDKNLILLHKLKDEYVNDKRTGERIRSGYNSTGNLVQVELRLSKVAGEPFPDRYHGLITKCTLNPEIEEQELQGESLNFDTLMELVFG